MDRSFTLCSCRLARPFRLIADTVGAQEQTVARRYRRLRRDGALRVVGLLNPRVHGDAQWVVRVRAKPDDISRLADALVRRPEVTHANILSGWSELVCVVRAPLAEGPDGLLQRLPRTASVIDLDIDLVLHTFGEAGTEPWTAYGHTPGWRPDRSNPGDVRPLTAGRHARRPDGGGPGALRRASARMAGHPMPGWPITRVGPLREWHAASPPSRPPAPSSTTSTSFPCNSGSSSTAMIWLTTAPSHLESVGRHIAAHAEIASVAALSGRNNLMAIANLPRRRTPLSLPRRRVCRRRAYPDLRCEHPRPAPQADRVADLARSADQRASLNTVERQWVRHRISWSVVVLVGMGRTTTSRRVPRSAPCKAAPPVAVSSVGGPAMLHSGVGRRCR